MPEISLFRNVNEPSNPEYWDMIEYLEATRDSKWEDLVNTCRIIKDKDERDAFKRTMPTATLSGKFSYRSDANLVKHSSYLAMDLDDVENLLSVKRQLEQDKYVFSVFMSTSGTGLRVIFEIDQLKHREAWLGISQYLFETYGQISDVNGKNPSKPFVVSFDPYLYINPEKTIKWRKYIKETPIKRIEGFVDNDEDFKNILQQVIARGVDICPSYNEWLKVAFAISEKFGENGRQYFHDVSSQNDSYNHSQCDKQFSACLKAKGTMKNVNISTFYYLAKAAGISIASENTKKIVRATKSGKKSGLKVNQIVDNLLKFENISDSENIVQQIFDAPSEYNEEEETVLHELEMFISHNYSLKMNEITGYFEQHGVRLSQNDLNSLFIAAKKIIPKLDYPLMIRLLKSDFIEMYNPFFKFLDSDGIPVILPAIPDDKEKIYFSPLIDKLGSCIINDNPAYTIHFTRKWIVSIISAMHKIHSPLLHCLIGPPETGKTEFYRRLLPAELQEYYAESKLDKEKDDELLMTENIIIMDDELSGKSKVDSNKLKNITSKQHFSLRRPYGDHNEKILRYAVLCGTSNIKGIIVDPTPNRRMIPVYVDDINRELFNSIDKKELFMEAFRLYKEGFDWRVGRLDMGYLNTDIEEYKPVVKERELLLKYYSTGDEKMSATEMVVDLENLTKQRLSVHIIGRELTELGFEKKSTRTEMGAIVKKWFVKKLYNLPGNYVPQGSIRESQPERDDEIPLPF